MMRTAAVILNWNAATDTIACLRSMQRLDPPGAEIIVVDNGSSDDSFTRISVAFPDVVIIRSKTNVGYAAGNNIGIREALRRGYSFILVLNNDTIVAPDFLIHLETAMDDHEDVGVIGPKILYYGISSRIYAAGGRVSYALCTGVSGRQGEEDRKEEGDPNDVRRASFLSGCAFLARREVFERIGLLEERYFMYYEDLDFCVRAGQQFKLGYLPMSRIVHKVGAGGARWRDHSPLYNYYYTRNRLWFFLRREWWIRPYVVVFSLMNICLKSIVLLASLRGEAKSKVLTKEKLKSLWRGFFEGLHLQ